MTLRIAILQANKSSKWLSLLLLLCTMYIMPHMLGYANWYSSETTREILFFIPFMQVFLIGPVVFFYTKSLLNTKFSLERKDYWHFLPAILYGIYSLIVFVTDKLILDEYYFYADGRDKDLSDWYQALGLTSMGIYLTLSLRFYSNYRKRIYDEVSYADSILFSWIRNFMLAFLGIIILRVLFFIINPDWGQFGSQFWYYISFAFIFAYVAIAGYTNVVKYIAISDSGFTVYNVFEEDKKEESKKTEANKSTDKSDKTEQEPERSQHKIEGKIQLGENELSDWKEKLQLIMSEQRSYENPKLTLYDLAVDLNTNSKIISTVVNRGFKMNFNDYVNQYRVEAVKKKLMDGEHNKKTLLGVALECGFNSKATFNRAFKKSTSISPKEYLQRLSNK